nr:Unknown Function [uncultured bacterium]
MEDDADFERLSKLPDVDGFITISRLLLPQTFQSFQELREVAAKLNADMLLVYTFDTTFHEKDGSAALSLITLGLSPTQTMIVRVAASALLLDTRTGYIHAALEANEKREVTTNIWKSQKEADRARQDAERTAFKALISEFEKNWSRIVERGKKGA